MEKRQQSVQPFVAPSPSKVAGSGISVVGHCRIMHSLGPFHKRREGEGMIRIVLLVLAPLLWLPVAHAGTYTAASCSYTDVSNCASGTSCSGGGSHSVSDGDIINIPSGTCTWASTLTTTHSIDFVGSGTPNSGGGTFGAGTVNTKLIDNASGPLFYFNGITSTTQVAKVELMEMSAAGASANSIGGAIQIAGTCTNTAPYCPSARVDNILFTAGTWYGPISGGLILQDNVYGVADHNTSSEPSASAFFLCQINFDAWHGVGTYGDNSFAAADTFGTAESWFIENNQLNNVRAEDDDVTAGSQVGGARYVVRFNNFNTMQGEGTDGAHGTAWGGRPRGMRQMEVYYNTAWCSGSGNNYCGNVHGALGGTGFYLSNEGIPTANGCGGSPSFPNPCGFYEFLNIDIARFESTATPWNNCDGTQPWDQTPFTSTSICLDAIGFGGGGALYQNATPVLASNPGTACTTAGQCFPNPPLDPMYEAGEFISTGLALINGPVTVGSAGSRVIANNQYYAEVSMNAQSSSSSPFAGTTGTGYGTLANRPSTCTKGVGYWATDQGTWNSYNSSQEGVFYICTATNTWTSSYTPYTYPHPLDTGGVTSPPPAPAPAFFTWTGSLTKTIPVALNLSAVKTSVPITLNGARTSANASLSLGQSSATVNATDNISISCSCDLNAQTCTCSAK